MTLNTLYKKLQAAGLQCEKMKLNFYKGSECIVCDGIHVDTDYYGPEPSDDTWEKINICRKLAGKRFHTETRGHYTAVFIWEVPAV